MTKVSVVIPTYNRANLISKCIHSVLNQTCSSFELIVVDDGSTDNTKEIVYDIIEKNDAKIKYFYQENGGTYSARNLGLEKCQGKYVNFLDSDDFIMPNFLEVLIKILDSKPELGMVFCNSIRYDSDNSRITVSPLKTGKSYSKTRLNLIFRKGHVPHGASLIRRTCFEKTGHFNGKNRVAEDRFFNTVFAKFFNAIGIQNPLFVHVIHGSKNPQIPLGEQNSFISYDEQINNTEKPFLEKIKKDKILKKQYIFFENRIESEYNFSWGWSYYSRGHKEKAKSFLLQSLYSNLLNYKALYILVLNQINYYDRERATRYNLIEQKINNET
tara:strand:+ start:2388 stop:3371 length:984 start_codon:yes stop_codon:yes gene_type:complete